MRRNFILFVFGLISLNSFSQSNLPTPKIWLRADNQGTISNKWQDVSGHNYHAFTFNNQAKPDTVLFNFHNCFVFDSLSNPLKINYTAKKDAKLLVLAVYKPNTQEQEKGIWALGLDSTIQVKLSTQRLKNVYKFIKYNDSTSTTPTINSLSQNWKNKHIDTTMSFLYVGGSDSLNFTGKFAEFILFDTTLKTNEIWKIHTYLAVKYGISLRDMNYITSNDSVLWNYKNNITYKYDIACIGKDTNLQINQKQSAGNGGESPLIIAANGLKKTNDANTTQIVQGDFLIWGNNGKIISEFNEDTLNTAGVQRMSKSVWLMKRNGATANGISTQVILNASEIHGANSIKLVINKYGNILFPIDSSSIITSDSVDANGNYYFSGIQWDSDNSGSDVFGFQILKSTNRLSQNPPKHNNNEIDENHPILDCSLFPNPSINNYQITLKLNQELPVNVLIQDSNGKKIEERNYSGSSEYNIKGFIKDSGCYLVSIRSGKDIKTYKLIIQ